MTTGGFDSGSYRASLAAAVDTTAGAVCSLANPEGADIYVTRCILNIKTAGGTSKTVDAGIAANGSTSADNLLDGLDVSTAAGVFDNIKNPGTNGKAGQKWASGQYLTITASGALTNLVGEVIVEYVRLN